ncbi:MAG TPA: hypothetical protein VFA51_03545 [Candidatus Udaeobacter sp.]|nr:hypothetical protein [Candidatus Udaeobacter sp.]
MSEALATAWRECVRRADFEAAWQISDQALLARSNFVGANGFRNSNWGGEPLDGKRVLVRCCYGLGDTLQFIRYVPLLRRIARSVLVQAQAPIVKLLEHVDGIDCLTTREKTVAHEKYDVVIDLTELPHFFRTNLATIPAEIPYIDITPRKFSSTPNFRVGLVWCGSDWDPRRSLPVQYFADFDQIRGVALHILQRGSELLRRPSNFGIDSGNDDVYEAARTMAGLDLMITIDSMPAHLAGAMAVPTWVLLHSDCDWRWMLKRTDSPWYPSMRLFRQTTAGDWGPVVARVRHELTRQVKSRRSISEPIRRARELCRRPPNH